MLNLLQSRQQAISQIRHLLQNRFGLMTSKLGQHTSKYKKMFHPSLAINKKDITISPFSTSLNMAIGAYVIQSVMYL